MSRVLKVVAVRDSKSETFMAPGVSLTLGQAERDFRSAVNNPDTQVHKYPTDYDLFQIGEWDELTGKLVAFDTPQHIVKAIQLVDSVQ